MALGSITVDLLLKTGAFSSNAKQAERRLKDLGDKAKRAGTAIGVAFAGAVTASAVAIRSQINAMDDMSKAALRAGMQTEEFSRLAYAGSLADVEMGNLVTSMGRLARAQADAQRGLATQTDAFRKLGIEFEDSTGKMRSGMDVMKDFADVVQQRGNDPAVLAAGMQVFGRSFQNLIPLLSNGREGLQAAADEADRLGITLSAKAGKDAEEFNDNITRLQTSIQGLWQEVAIDLLPQLNEFALKLQSPEFRDGFKNLIEGAVGATRTLAQLALTTANVTKFLAESAAAAIHGTNPEDIVRVEQRITRIKDAMESLRRGGYNPVEMSGNLAGIGLPSGRALELNEDFIRGRRGSLIRKLNEELLKEENKLALGVKLRDDAVSEAQRLAEEAVAGVAAPSIDLDLGLGGGPSGSEAQKQLEHLNVEFLSLNQSLERQIALFGESGYAAAMAYDLANGSLSNLAQTQKDMLMEQAEWLDFMEDMRAVEDAWAGVQAQVDVATGEMTTFADQAARNIQSTLGDSLYDVLDGNFKGIADSFSDMIKRMLAEAAAAKLLEGLAGWATGYTGAGSGWINAIGSGLSGRRATGGPVYPGGTFLVGENGPELLRMGNNSGTIVPNNRLASLGGGASPVKVEVINNGQPMQATASQQTMPDGTQLVRVVLNAVAESIGSGTGPINPALRGRFGLREAV